MMQTMNFDFAKHRVCLMGEEWGDGSFCFFNCVVCGQRWERADRVYVVEGEAALGQCCPECTISLIDQGAVYEEWEEGAGNA
jgi:hypothetical protein